MIQTLTIEKLQGLCGIVQRHFPEAHVVIAGGAPRDVLNKRPVKDIDVFIQLDDDIEPDELILHWDEGCEGLADELHSTRNVVAPFVDKGQMRPEGISEEYADAVYSLVDLPEGFHMYPVQLVFIEEHPVDNIKRHFDFGLSQVWVTPNQLRMTKAYWHDHFGQRITYMGSAEPNEQRRKSSIARLARLREKYAGWRFERCGGLATPIQVPARGEPW